MKVGIYGGTFDPPHLGHMRAARAALGLLGLDELILIPAKQPPHKALSEGSAPAEDRLAMTGLMADGLLDERVSVSRIELDREGKSYTADTLREIHEQRPEDELFLLMGTDMYLTFQDWYKPEEIARLATLVPLPALGPTPASSSASRGSIWTGPWGPGPLPWSCLRSPSCPPPSCARAWPWVCTRTSCGCRCGATSSAMGCTAWSGT